jgi:hypothetical protein
MVLVDRPSRDTIPLKSLIRRPADTTNQSLSPILALLKVSEPPGVRASLPLPSALPFGAFEILAEFLALRLQCRKDVEQVRLFGLRRYKIFERILQKKKKKIFSTTCAYNDM